MANEIIVSEIQDSWETMIDKINKGTADYSIGQYKPLDLGCQGVVRMQIVGKNVTPLAECEDETATYDFISMDIPLTENQMNVRHFVKNPWEQSFMRTYLNEFVILIVPRVVRNAIKPVRKITCNHDGNMAITNDRLWIPSYREIFGGTDVESEGPVYSSIYTDSTSRVKNIGGWNAWLWWLRSACSGVSGSIFRCVDTNGAAGSYYANYSLGVALSFCI